MLAEPLSYERVSLGNFSTCAVSSDDLVHCWGANDDGQLGVGDSERRAFPAPVL
jgi:hypothetical protein